MKRLEFMAIALGLLDWAITMPNKRRELLR